MGKLEILCEKEAKILAKVSKDPTLFESIFNFVAKQTYLLKKDNEVTTYWKAKVKLYDSALKEAKKTSKFLEKEITNHNPYKCSFPYNQL